MQTKRLIVFGVSAIVAAAVTFLVVFVVFGTTAAHFAYSNIALLFIAVFGIVGIWLDYLLGAQILKS